MEYLSTTLKQRRKELGMTLAQVAGQMGVSEATVQRWESGNIKNIRYERIQKLAEILQVPPQSFMGWKEPNPSIPAPSGPQIPLVGEIACGPPILAEQNITGYVTPPGQVRADFALICEGDSMINAGIRDGDIVYIRAQEKVENGQIAAVRVGEDEATLKRFYYDGDSVRLLAENPSVPTRVYVGEEMLQIHIIGLAVGYTHIF